MTDDDLREIEERWQGAALSVVTDDHTGYHLVTDHKAALVKSKSRLQARRFAQAPTDIARLLAGVRRLREASAAILARLFKTERALELSMDALRRQRERVRSVCEDHVGRSLCDDRPDGETDAIWEMNVDIAHALAEFEVEPDDA